MIRRRMEATPRSWESTMSETAIAAAPRSQGKVLLPPAHLEPARARSAYADLFFISFAILFLEMACIRWFGSAVLFLTFFTNLVMMACFLGMSAGLLAAPRRHTFVTWVIPVTLTAVGMAELTSWAYAHFGNLALDVGGQVSPQQVYFGTESPRGDLSKFVVPIEFVAAAFFTVISLMFVGLGQAMGRAFDAVPDRVAAYSVDVLGSLAGIGAFGLVSYLQTSPVVWFAVGLAAVFRSLPRVSRVQFYGLLALIVLLATAGTRDGGRFLTFWSPYYRIAYHPRSRMIETNNIGHQVIVDVHRDGPAYSLPYLLNRDAGGPAFDDVLIVGAGSGNDVAAALWHGARSVDAVEIDPAVYRIGRVDHPNRPYSNARVSVHLDDGRSFVKTIDRAYDLAAYALVDSLVLHSGYSSLRLESFLFTEEALRDVKAKLKPGGAFVMYNAYRQGWVVGRLALLAEKVFGTKPIVLSMPHVDAITPTENQGSRITCLIAGLPASPFVNRVREAFATRGSYWLASVPEVGVQANGFGKEPPRVPGYDGFWSVVRPVRVETDGVGPLPTDAWPFLYLRAAVVPSLNLRGMALVAGISLAIVMAFVPTRTVRPSGRMFFLGAGFMLLESKSVVHMALLFGSTWVVNSVVFAAVLVMILLSNLFVALARPRGLWAYYVLLGAALGVNTLVPMSAFLGLAGPARAVVSCAVVFMPVFFAGVVFAVAFRDSPRPDVAFGSNVLGVVLGGMAENLSLVLGFDYLLVIAIAFYAFSALPGGHANHVPAAAP
jgi:SAM-dependent methyltransferase